MTEVSDDDSFKRVQGPKMQEKNDICEKHGAFKSYSFRVNVWSGCDTCRLEDDRKRRIEELAQQDREHAERKWQKVLGRAAIPERFADRTLDSYRPANQAAKRAHDIATQYAVEFADVKKTGRGLILSGNVGTGKTHLAIGIAHQIMKAGYQPVFVSVIKAVRKIKETYGRDKEQTEDEAINDFIVPDLLILDEVGVQFGSETEKMYLFEIINGRYEKRQPTILISNLTIPEFTKFVGERVMDRMREDGGRAVVFDWSSERKNI